MRKLTLLLSFVFVVFGSQAQQYTAIGFYNLENLFDTFNDSLKNDDDFTPNGSYSYTEQIFRKKLTNLSDVISLMGIEKNKDGVALLGVAEVENKYVLDELTKETKLAPRHYKIVHFESPDNRGIDVGLLYNPNYFKVLAASSLTVSLAEFGEDYPTRDILFVSGKLQGEIIHVFVNHWPSRRGGEAASSPKRQKAASVCKRTIDSLRKDNPEVKIVIMGDLNDDPINASVNDVLNATGKLADAKGNKLYNPWLDFYKQGIGTIAWQDAWGLFDQIIISPGLANKKATGLKYASAEVFNRNFLIEKFGQYKGYPKRTFSWGKWNDGYSDHFPTLIYLKQ